MRKRVEKDIEALGKDCYEVYRSILWLESEVNNKDKEYDKKVYKKVIKRTESIGKELGRLEKKLKKIDSKIIEMWKNDENIQGENK